MEFKKYILKKFDYNVNVSNKKFYTPDETIKQKLGINVKFLKDKKNMLLTFKIDMIDNDDINILKLKVKYILTLNNEALDINESFIKKILSKFYPIFSKFISYSFSSICLIASSDNFSNLFSLSATLNSNIKALLFLFLGSNITSYLPKPASKLDVT